MLQETKKYTKADGQRDHGFGRVAGPMETRPVALGLSAAVGLLALVSHAKLGAQTIYDTTGSTGQVSAPGWVVPGGGVGNQYPNGFWVATLFQTTATEYVISGISFGLANTAGDVQGNLKVQIFSDNSGVPGTQVGTDIGSIDMAGISTSISLTGLSVTLQPSTSYWLKFDDANLTPGINGVQTGILKWIYTESASGVGSAFALAQPSDKDNLQAGGESFADNALIGQITVAAVPEPSTYAALSAMALTGFGVWRRMRR